MDLPIRTPRLELRRFTLEDARDLGRYVSKPDVVEFDSAYPTDPEGLRSVAEYFAAAVEDTGTPEFLAVCLLQDGLLIGHLHVGQRDDSEPGTRNIGFVFDSAYWGRGLAFEACTAVLEVLAADGTPGVLTGTRLANMRARALLSRLGFVRVPADDPSEYVVALRLARRDGGSPATGRGV